MTNAYNVRQKLYRSLEADRATVADPGDAGTIRVSPTDLAVCVVTGGTTRTLQDATTLPLGASILVMSQTTTITINSVALSDGEWEHFRVVLNSSSVNVWASSRASEAITRLEAHAERAVISDIPVPRWRIWDSLDAQLGATPTSADDLAHIVGTYLTDSPYLTTTSQTPGDANPVLSYARYMLAVPHDYTAGAALTLQVAWSRPDAAGTSMTLDSFAVRTSAPTVDIQSTAAVDINGAAGGTVNFVLTPTNIVPGETLNIRLLITAVSNGSSYEGRITNTALVYTPVVA